MSALMGRVAHAKRIHDFIEAAAKGVIGIRRAVFMLADISLIFPLYEPWVNILMNRDSTALSGGCL